MRGWRQEERRGHGTLASRGDAAAGRDADAEAALGEPEVEVDGFLEHVLVEV